jgi:parvulin-like peptidyl-prolyl isomerase
VSRPSAPPLGALALALLATALGACRPAAPREAAPAVATWHGGRLERADYESWRAYHDYEDGPEAVRELAFVTSLATAGEGRGVEREIRTRLELEAMRNQVLVAALERRVEGAVTVDDAEIEDLHREYPDAFQRPRKLLLRNIYKRLDDPSGAAAVRARMEQIRRRALGGADFKELARRESESQTRFRDGSLGFLAVDKLPPPVAAAVRDLKPGEVSAVVEHGGGLSLFLCEDVRAAASPTPEQVRSKLRANLLRQRRRQAWVRARKGLWDAAAPKLSPGATTVLEMAGYRLSGDELAEIVPVLLPHKTLADLDGPRVESLLRLWAVGVLGARRAVELGLDREPEVATALRWRRLEVLAQRELVHRIDARLHEPSEEEVRSRFEAAPERFREPATLEVAAIRFDLGKGAEQRRRVELAEDVARRLESGDLTFEQAARRYSIHPSAAAGGLVGWLTRRQIAGWGPVATNALRRMKRGELSGLLHLDSGLWIFALRDQRPARSLTYEAAKPRIARALRQERIHELEGAVRRQQLDGIGLVIVEKRGGPQGAAGAVGDAGASPGSGSATGSAGSPSRL